MDQTPTRTPLTQDFAGIARTCMADTVGQGSTRWGCPSTRSTTTSSEAEGRDAGEPRAAPQSKAPHDKTPSAEVHSHGNKASDKKDDRNPLA